MFAVSLAPLPLLVTGFVLDPLVPRSPVHALPLLLYLLVCEATNKLGHGGWNDFLLH